MNNSKRVTLRRVQTPNSSFTVVTPTKTPSEIPQRPTIKMSKEEIDVILSIDASMKDREDRLEKTKHTRPTLQMSAVKI